MGEKNSRRKSREIESDPEEKNRRALLQRALACMLSPARAEESMEALLGAFGSFSGIVGAPEAALARIDGVGEETARFLRLTLELAQACMEDQAAGLKRIYDTESAVGAFRPKFLGRKTEAVGLMLLDGRGRMIYNDILCEGSVTEVPVYIRRLMGLCIEYNAQELMIAHNHPSGNAAPSRNDIVVTRQLEMALESIDASLEDHIIFAGKDYYSFLTSGLLGVEKKRLRDYRRSQLEEARELEQELLRNGPLQSRDER